MDWFKNQMEFLAEFIQKENKNVILMILTLEFVIYVKNLLTQMMLS